ncbi:uncharacterized protein IL334_000435 [Kwoniella shivajii]|uniref:Protein SMG7 n=1 Tax=Kwoniella shivajii TaxID=564305 RepID=A0ABZ1CQP9_9TREE|nr:hypothetical protein IL334_000435 [Kwoniella shivajii]
MSNRQNTRKASESRRSASDLDRDAKGEAGNLKNLLTVQLPWSREVDSCRKRCRDIHLLLLFSHPLSPYAQSLDNLWYHTSYLLITSYRSIISSLEKSLPPPPFPSNPSSNSRRGGRTDNNHTQNNIGQNQNQNQNELKKSSTRFRQFLSSEETFYKSLISRLVRFYDLYDINDLSNYLLQARIPISQSEQQQQGQGQRPSEGDELDIGNIGKEEKRDKLSLIYKAVICLGDLERYKEQYNEKPKSSKDNKHNSSSSSRRRLVGNNQEEKFSQARKYYEIARKLLPDDGSAFNQLAVISTYLADSFSTTYYYFRAFAIRNAFKGIDGILYDHLGKATERWRVRRREEKERDIQDVIMDVRDEVKRWKEEMIVLVGILYLKAGFSLLPTLQPNLLGRFSSLLKSRQLSTEVIVQSAVIVIGSHYHARNTAGLEQDPKLVQRSHEAELRALDLLLGVFEAIMQIGIEELEEFRSTLGGESALEIEQDDEDDDGIDTHLYQYISAILRRILPSLRIVSKWIKLDLEYLARQQSSPTLKSFWTTYKRFIDSVSTVFPIAQLPSLTEPLEEDIDMKGFLPLQRGITIEGGFNSGVNEIEGNDPIVQGEVHPNEEQLMRIADIQVDARLIMQSGIGALLLGVQPLGLVPAVFGVPRDQESDIASVSTETEDDPVNLAMRATLASESSVNGDEEAEEIIVWGKSPLPPNVPAPSTIGNISAAIPSNKKPTAYDLLQNLMLESTPTPPARSTILPQNPPTASSPSMGITSSASPHLQGVGNDNLSTPGGGGLLFGASGGAAQGSSIWTMTREESEKGQKRSSFSGQGANSGAGGNDLAAIWGNSTQTETAPNHTNNVPMLPTTSFLPQLPGPAPAPSAPPTIPQPNLYSHAQYSYTPPPQQQQSNTWGMSSVPLPLPQAQSISPAYPYDHNQQIPYYAQPAYYTQSYGKWGPVPGSGTGGYQNPP